MGHPKAASHKEFVASSNAKHQPHSVRLSSKPVVASNRGITSTFAGTTGVAPLQEQVFSSPANWGYYEHLSLWPPRNALFAQRTRR